MLHINLTVKIMMRIIAQLALIAAIKDASESIITTIAAMHIVDIHK